MSSKNGMRRDTVVFGTRARLALEVSLARSISLLSLSPRHVGWICMLAGDFDSLLEAP